MGLTGLKPRGQLCRFLLEAPRESLLLASPASSQQCSILSLSLLLSAHQLLSYKDLCDDIRPTRIISPSQGPLLSYIGKVLFAYKVTFTGSGD